MAGAWEEGPEQYTLVLATPTVGLVSFEWALNTYSLDKPGTATIRGWKGLPFDVARNLLVKDARRLKARHIWFLDSDVLPSRLAAL